MAETGTSNVSRNAADRIQTPEDVKIDANRLQLKVSQSATFEKRDAEKRDKIPEVRKEKNNREVGVNHHTEEANEEVISTMNQELPSAQDEEKEEKMQSRYFEFQSVPHPHCYACNKLRQEESGESFRRSVDDICRASEQIEDFMQRLSSPHLRPHPSCYACSVAGGTTNKRDSSQERDNVSEKGAYLRHSDSCHHCVSNDSIHPEWVTCSEFRQKENGGRDSKGTRKAASQIADFMARLAEAYIGVHRRCLACEMRGDESGREPEIRTAEIESRSQAPIPEKKKHTKLSSKFIDVGVGSTLRTEDKSTTTAIDRGNKLTKMGILSRISRKLKQFFCSCLHKNKVGINGSDGLRRPPSLQDENTAKEENFPFLVIQRFNIEERVIPKSYSPTITTYIDENWAIMHETGSSNDTSSFGNEDSKKPSCCERIKNLFRKQQKL